VLHELLRTSAAVALLVNPNNPVTEPETKGMRDAARSLGLQLHVLDASTEGEIDAAFEKLIELRAGGLLVGVDALFTNQRDQIVALAARHAVPAIYGVREFATAGGLMSYGTDLADAYRQAGLYAGKILKGIRPADTGATGREDRDGRQSQDRQDAWHYLPVAAHRPRRRGDRMRVICCGA
jgi:putative ABC transport system substrate-binding protein